MPPRSRRQWRTAALLPTSSSPSTTREPLNAGSSYDVVIMWLVLLYLPDKAGALTRVGRTHARTP